MIRDGGVTLLLGARLIPIFPFSITGYAAGAARVNLWRFIWTTGVGYLPLTVAVAYLGSRAQSLSVGGPAVWVTVVPLLGLLAAARVVMVRRVRGQPPPARWASPRGRRRLPHCQPRSLRRERTEEKRPPGRSTRREHA